MQFISSLRYVLLAVTRYFVEQTFFLIIEKKTFCSLENYKIFFKVANKMPKTPKRWLSLSLHSKPYPFLQIATMVHLAKKLSWHPNSPNERKIYSVSSWFSFVDMCVFPGGQLSLPGLPFFSSSAHIPYSWIFRRSL